MVCIAQEQLIGVVVDPYSTPISGASVQVLSLKNKGVTTTANGKFTIPLQSGKYTITVRYVGYATNTQTIEIKQGVPTRLTIPLQDAVNELDDVLVKGKSEAQQRKEKAFEVEVVETKGLKNNSTDITAVLNTIPGVNVRQRGGLGADFNFSLNGLSGKQIKFFIDGIPLENLGSSLSLNNFPATLVERVEVFKGVVPIHLGSDALGGAVNIITNQRKNDFLDVSYDVGSFNTHRITLNGRYHTAKGFMIKASSFYNYSDNDYTIDDIEVRDALGNDTGITRDNVKRFHDAYDSQMINVQSGFVDQRFADRFLIGITASANKNEIQHPIDPQNPFGEVFTKSNVLIASVLYEKENLLKEKLNVKLYAAIGQNNEKVVDTSARKYDWFGGFIERGDQSLGEFEFNKTLFDFKDNTHLINALVRYKINEKHHLTVNYTKNYIKREGEDPARLGRNAFQEPHVVDKNIIGVSYDVHLFDEKWNTTLFSKGYLLNSKGVIEDFFANTDTDRFTKTKSEFEELGYGFASTYTFSEGIQIKGSFERTFRVPEGYEVFGDGLLLKPNPELKPEESYNANLGFLLNAALQKFALRFDTNVFFRETENFINIRSEGVFAKFLNTAAARSTGVEAELKTRYNDRIFLDINATYQNSIDRNKGENQGIDFLKNQRIPNIPYLFGNVQLGCNYKGVVVSHDHLTLSWNSYYVHNYPLTSFVEGNPDDRDIIPEQLSHTLQWTYSLKKGKYNIAFQVRNVTDEKIYDNFEIQQPGRAFYVKLRYYITN